MSNPHSEISDLKREIRTLEADIRDLEEQVRYLSQFHPSKIEHNTPDPSDVFDMDASEKVPVEDEDSTADYKEYNITEDVARKFLYYQPSKIVVNPRSGGMMWNNQRLMVGDRKQAEFLYDVFSTEFDVEIEEQSTRD